MDYDVSEWVSGWLAVRGEDGRMDEDVREQVSGWLRRRGLKDG